MTIFCFNLINTIITKQAVDDITSYVHQRMTQGGHGSLVDKIKRKEANDIESEAYQVEYEKYVGEAYDSVYGQLSQQGSFFVHGTQQVFNNILQAKKDHKIAITTFNASIGLVGKVVKELSRNAEGIVDYSGRVVLVTGGLQNNGTMPSHRKNIHLVELQERLRVPKSSIVFVDREKISRENAWGTEVDNGNFESAALSNQCLVAIKMDSRGAWKERVQELAEGRAKWFQRDARSKHKFFGSHPVVWYPDDLKLNLQGGVECWQPRGGKVAPSTAEGLRPVKIAIYNGEKVKVAETTYDESGRVYRGGYQEWRPAVAINPTYDMHDPRDLLASQQQGNQLHQPAYAINPTYDMHNPEDLLAFQQQQGSQSYRLGSYGYRPLAHQARRHSDQVTHSGVDNPLFVLPGTLVKSSTVGSHQKRSAADHHLRQGSSA